MEEIMMMFANSQDPIGGEDVVRGLRDVINAFNWRVLAMLIVGLFVAFLIGRVVAWLLQQLSKYLRIKADASKDIRAVNRLRRLETWSILMIAVVQVGLVIAAVYLWWNITGEGSGRSSAILGAGAVAVVLIGSITRPLLADIASGVSMMAEHWYGVGDMVTVEYPKTQGVVEAITLRSTKIRGINGETYWLANSAMNGVSVAKRGLLWIAVELFVSDIKKAEALVDRVNSLLPTGPSLVVEPLVITKLEQRDKDIWHLTAVAGVAPGREWTINEMAVETFKKLDEKNKKPILHIDPVTHYDDKVAETQIKRAVTNARKPRRKFDYSKLSRAQIAARTKSQKSQPKS